MSSYIYLFTLSTVRLNVVTKEDHTKRKKMTAERAKLENMAAVAAEDTRTLD